MWMVDTFFCCCCHYFSDTHYYVLCSMYRRKKFSTIILLSFVMMKWMDPIFFVVFPFFYCLVLFRECAWRSPSGHHHHHHHHHDHRHQHHRQEKWMNELKRFFFLPSLHSLVIPKYSTLGYTTINFPISFRCCRCWNSWNDGDHHHHHHS